jgi:hypothetical protein
VKDQYVGDENDYHKYGLLRILAGDGVRATVGWMRTPNDGRSDGGCVAYLDQPERWKRYDPQLFEVLADLVREGQRNLRAVEQSGILPGARFFRDLLPEAAAGRALHFARLGRLARRGDLLFLDPDNGVEVPSVPYGRSGSSRYLYLREVEALYRTGPSLLLYQHFPRVERASFVRRVAERCLAATGASRAVSFRTRRVFFLLLPQPNEEALYLKQSEAVARAWEGEIEVAVHRVGGSPHGDVEGGAGRSGRLPGVLSCEVTHAPGVTSDQ